MVVHFPSRFTEIADAAILRLQVHYPKLEFAVTGAAIEILNVATDQATQEEVRRQVLHTLYREKIYAETLPLRQALVAAVTGR